MDDRRILPRISAAFYPTWDRKLEEELVGQFDLARDRKLRHLSRGMRMKAALASSLAYRPKLVVLDEPFTGLDTEGRKWVGEFLRAFKARGGAAVLVTHSLGAALEISDRVAVLAGGQLVADRPCAQLSADDLNKLYTSLTESESPSDPGSAR